MLLLYYGDLSESLRVNTPLHRLLLENIQVLLPD